VDRLDGQSAEPAPAGTTLMLVTIGCGAGFAAVLTVLLRTLRIARPLLVTTVTTIGLSVATVLWWRLGPEAGNLSVLSALFVLPVVAFALCTGSALAAGQKG